MILAIIGGTIIAGYLKMSLKEYQLSQRTLKLQSTMNLAEAGLELGMNAINTKDWTGWTAVGTNGKFRDITNIAFTDGRIARIRVYLEDFNSTPILAAEGRVIEPDGSELFKQVRVDMTSSGLFSNGLTAKDSINFNGNNVTVDAYDSTVGVWNYTLNRVDEGSVASLSVDNGALDVGNGDIWGYLATAGGTYDIGNNGSVMGADTPTGVTEDPNRISYDFKASLPDVSAPGLTPDHITLAAGSIGDPTASWSSDPVVYHISSFSMSGHNTITVVGPTILIVDGDFKLSGQAELNIVGTESYLQMYVGGDLDLTGQGVLNDEQKPEAFQVWGTAASGTSQSIKVAGNGDFAGILYAPNADLEIKGNGNVSGAAVGENITLTGNAAFHYDLNLKNLDSDGSYAISRWRELRGTSEWLDFSNNTSLANSISPL
jgi:hypothetical protein